MSSFIDYIEDIFSALGNVSSRKMFGGYGIFHEGVMFGLVADDVLYLKADEQSAHLFEQKGLIQFGYTKGAKEVKMSYFQAPEEVFEDADVAGIWARRAYDCGVRAKEGRRK